MNADEQEGPQGCTPEALVENVADAIAKAWDEEGRVTDAAHAAIAVLKPLLRAEVLEEAAKVAEYRIGAAEWSAETNSGYECASKEIAAAIRALKEDK